MKKVILILFAALVSMVGYAAEPGDGLTTETAIEFSWEKGNKHPGNNEALWYRVSLAPIYDEEDPTLALYLTNLSYNSADVQISAVIGGSEEVRDYTIAPRKDRIWNQSAKMLVRMKYTEILVKLTASESVMLSAKVFDAEDADESCISATDYNWNDHTVNAGNRWYKLNLADIRSKRQEIQIVYTATEECELNSTISPNCPSTGLTGDAAVIAAGGSYTHTITRALIQNLADDELYLKVENYKRVTVSTKLIDEPVVAPTYNFAQDETISVEDLTGATLKTVEATGKTFVVAIEDIKGKKLQPEIGFVNDSNKLTDATVDVQIAFSATNTGFTTKDVILKNITVPAGETAVMDFAKNMIDGLDTTLVKYVFVKIIPSQDIYVYARKKHVHEGNACKSAQDLPWNSTTYQDGETTVWYAIDITEAKDVKNPQNITITVTNRANAKAYVTADMAFDCPYIDLQTVTRLLSPNASISKTLNYSMYGMMEKNVVYVGVTTDQPIKVDVEMTPVEKKVADDKCLDAIKFDWEYGHEQKANDTVWYKVGVNDVRNTNLIPEVVITNRANAPVRIYGELSIDCPDSIVNDNRTMNIAANGTYSKVISRDMLRNLSADTVYIMLTADQPFAFRVNQSREDEGASCASAILFNWVSGNDQVADTTIWYKMALTDVKAANGKRVRAIIKNLNKTKQGEVSGLLAATCPCETPQAQSFKIAAGAENVRLIPRSTFETFGDTVYIRLTSTTKIHFEAHLEDADPFDTIFVCDEAHGAKEVKFEQVYNQTVDTAWYYVLTAPILGETVKTPQLRIKNGAADQTLKAEIAYHCPVTEEMSSRTRTFTAGQEMKKVIERSLAEQVADKDTVFIRIIGTGAFEFEVNMVDPNTGDDCQHAMIITPDSTIHQKAGVWAWYRFNVAQYGANTDDKARLSLGNEDGVAGAVDVTLYDACEGEVMQSGKATLGANAVRTKEIMCEQFSGLGKEWVYLHIYTAQNDSLLLQIIPRADIDTIWACQEAVPFAVNTDFEQGAGDTVWYSINVKDIRENTMGDATLTVTNLAAKTNAIQAHMSWVCPVTKEMSSKGQTVAANDKYVRAIERSNFNMANGHDIAYVRVISPEAMKFRIDIALAKGDECTNPVEFDWVNGNTNPKGECVWYNVRMVKDTVIDGRDTTVLLVPEGKDLRLNIQNLSDQTATASASIRFECNEKALGTYDYSFDGNAIKHKDISRKRLTSVNPTSLLINFCSQQAMHITAEFINAKADSICYDTIRPMGVCDGDSYLDMIPKTAAYHDIDMSDPTTLTWNDTVSIPVGTIVIDSIYTIIINPLEAVAKVDYATVPDTAKLVVAQGMMVDISRLNNYLTDYYKTQTTAADSLADFDNLTWYAYDETVSNWRPYDKVDVLKSVLDTTVKNIHIAYKVETECSTVTIEDTLHFTPVLAWKVVTQNATDVFCMNDNYSWRGQTGTFTGGKLELTDTILNVTANWDTLGVTYQRQMDSIFSYTITLKANPTLPTDADVTVDPAMAYHKTFDMNPYTTLLNGYFTSNYGSSAYSQVDVITWERKNSDDTYTALTGGKDTVITDATVVLRYVVTTECGDKLYSADYTFTPTPDCTVYDATTLTITWPKAYCGTPYQDSLVLAAVQQQLTAAGSTDNMTLYYRYDATEAWKTYVKGTALTVGEDEVMFYLEIASDCGYKSQTAAVTLTIETPDMADTDYERFTSLPAVMKYGGLIIMLDLRAIETNYNFVPEEKDVDWYEMTGATPDPSKDILVLSGKYYYTISTIGEAKTLVNNYYALVDMPEQTDACGGKYRTSIVSKTNTGMSAPARKQLIDGRLYITTEDNTMYNAQGQKVEQ